MSQVSFSSRPASSIETARLFAVLSLVAYHVVGRTSAEGLGIAETSMLRLVLDLLADVRMPLFAAIAGFVFGLKPPTERTLGAFLTGKVRRLMLPGAVAITVFLAASELAGLRFAMGTNWWRAFLFPYAHFWFLQAILMIFVVYGTFDALTRGRWLWQSLAVSVGLYLLKPQWGAELFSFDRAFYLLPYFLLGLCLCRYRTQLDRLMGATALFAAGLCVIGLIGTFSSLAETGRISLDPRDFQSLALGGGAIILALRYFPALKGMQWFGPVSFTIYLYHVFGTSLSRRVLQACGVQDTGVLFAVGMIAGIGVPMALHFAMQRTKIGQVALFGPRPKSVAS